MVYDCRRVFFARRVGQHLERASSRMQGRVSNRAIYRGIRARYFCAAHAQKHLMHYVFYNAYHVAP